MARKRFLAGVLLLLVAGLSLADPITILSGPRCFGCSTEEGGGGAAAFFSDDFTGYSVGTTNAGINGSGGGFAWLGGGFLQVVDISSFQGGLATNRAVEFNLDEGNNAQMNFLVNDPGIQEFWMRYDLYYPSGSESPNIGANCHRSGELPFGGDNNKFLRLWKGNHSDGANGYSNLYVKIGASTSQSGASGEELYIEYGTNGNGVGPGGSSGSSPGGGINPFMTDALRGAWRRYGWHIKAATSANNNGVMELWRDGVQLFSVTNMASYPSATGDVNNRFEYGYLMGFPNGLYTGNCKVYMTNFAISDEGMP